jgi:integrase
MIAKNEDGLRVSDEGFFGTRDGSEQASRRGPGRPKGSKNRRIKKKKPFRSFPLTLHSTGQYCKKIRGKIQYFGTDPDVALQRYRAQCDDLHSGRVTSVDKSGSLTIGMLIDRFLNDAKAKQERGEIAARTFMDYYRDCKRVAVFFRTTKTVQAITDDELMAFRSRLAKGVGPVTLHGRLGVARSLFNFAWEEGLIATPLRLKKGLKRPPLKQLRKARRESGREYFYADEIRRLLDQTQADVTFRAMILLGINCGLGNTDIASLPRQSVDLQGGWLDFPRIKTGIERRCPLWPETVEAIRGHIELAKPGATVDTKGLLFVTRKGQKFVRSVLKETSAGTPRLVEHDAIVQRIKKVMKAAGIELPGVGFYGLRKSCETFGAETGEQVAVDHIMGHAPSVDNMGDLYRCYVAEEPLRRVTAHIRRKVLLAQD